MEDWTDAAIPELAQVIQDAMDEGHHENFKSFYDFLRACVDHYEQESVFGGEFEDRIDDIGVTVPDTRIENWKKPVHITGSTNHDKEPSCYCEQGHYGMHESHCQYKAWKDKQ